MIALIKNRKIKNILRLVVMVLIISFLTQDIAWAYPDKLAPGTFFRKPDSQARAAKQYVDTAITQTGIPREKLTPATLAAVARMQAKFGGTKNIKAVQEKAFEELENAIYKALERYSNVHRGTGQHSQITTALFEEARNIILDYFGVDKKKYVVIFGDEMTLSALKASLRPGSASDQSHYEIFSNDLGLPLGIGALVVNKKFLPKKTPPITGGGTVKLVLENKVFWADAPEKFEPGTPNIIGVIALAKALTMIKDLNDPELFKAEPRDFSPEDILYKDNLGQVNHIELLNKLKEELVGKDLEVFTSDSMPKPYVNFDNAASTPTFKPIWESARKALRLSNIAAKHLIEEVRGIACDFFGAPADKYDVIFAQNTTEAINVAAEDFASMDFGDIEPIIVTSYLEHNSNELPWRHIKGVKQIRLSVDKNGFFDADELEDLLNDYNFYNTHGRKRIVLVALSGASNVLGTKNDMKDIAGLCHKYRAELLVDAAQLAAHSPVNMDEWSIDYLVFSAHKMYAPFGSGGLIARKELLHSKRTELNRKNIKKANIVGIAALGKAMILLKRIGLDVIQKHEQGLMDHALDRLSEIKRIKIYGITDAANLKNKVGVFSFRMGRIKPRRLAELLALNGGIGVRQGCFCAHLLVQRLTKSKMREFIESINKIPAPPKWFIKIFFSIMLVHFVFCPCAMIAVPILLVPNIIFWSPIGKIVERIMPGMVRISFGLYNTKEEIGRLSYTLSAIAKSSGTASVSDNSQLSTQGSQLNSRQSASGAEEIYKLSEDERRILRTFVSISAQPNFGYFCFNTGDAEYPAIIKGIELSGAEFNELENNFFKFVFTQEDILAAGKKLVHLNLKLKKLKEELGIVKIIEDDERILQVLENYRNAASDFERMLKEKELSFVRGRGLDYSGEIVHVLTRKDIDSDIDPVTLRPLMHTDIAHVEIPHEILAEARMRQERRSRAAEKRRETQHIDYYEILGVSKKATAGAIKAAYRKMVRIYHPDVVQIPDGLSEEEKGQLSADYKQKLLDAIEAYKVLSDASSRGLYDLGITLSGKKKQKPKALDGRKSSSGTKVADYEIEAETGRIRYKAGYKPPELKCEIWGIRHGRTPGNVRNCLQGMVDGPDNQLDEVGQLQANDAAGILIEKFGSSLTDKDKFVILASPLGRTKETASISKDLITERLGIDVEIIEEPMISEIDFGESDGKTIEELPEDAAKDAAAYRNLNAVIKVGGGENFLITLGRAKEFIKYVNEKYPGKTLILFTHGVFSNALRVVLGDPDLIDEGGIINYRKDFLPNAAPYQFNSIKSKLTPPKQEPSQGTSMDEKSSATKTDDTTGATSYVDKDTRMSQNDTFPEYEQSFTSNIASLRNLLAQDILAYSANQEPIPDTNISSPRALIVYADSMLEQAAIMDLEDTVSKSSLFNNSTVIIYGQKNENISILENMIKKANTTINTIAVRPEDLLQRYNTEYNEAKELDALVRLSRAKGVNSGTLLGVIKGRTDDIYLDKIQDISKEHKLPIVTFEPEGIYSFSQIISAILQARNNNNWFIKLPPLRKINEDIKKAYENYIMALKEAQTKA